MKKLTLSIAILSTSAFFIACGGAEQKPAETTETQQEETTGVATPELASGAINTEESTILWKGEMLGIKDHTGTLNFKSGKIKTENGKIVSGDFVVDMTSMVATDENYNPEEGSTKEKLIGHLSSPEFFAVEMYPEATFEIVAESEGNLAGKLTIRDKTNQVEVTDVAFDAETNTYTGTLVFNRKDFDVSWDSPMKEAVLSDEIELNISIKI